MPDTGFLFLSTLCLMAAVSFILFPNPLLKLSTALNRTLVMLDQRLMRHRYLMGALLFVVSYLLFNLALRIPELRG